MHRKITLFFLFNLYVTCSLFGQGEYKNESENDPGFEVVISALSIYDTESKTSDFAAELHLTYWVTHQWAFGVGYSFVFEEDNRIGHEIAALVSHKPWSFLTLNGGPSFSLPNSHQNTEVSAYLESEFAFEIGNLHSGPTAGLLLGEAVRIFGGWHISFEF